MLLRNLLVVLGGDEFLLANKRSRGVQRARWADQEQNDLASVGRNRGWSDCSVKLLIHCYQEIFMPTVICSLNLSVKLFFVSAISESEDEQ